MIPFTFYFQYPTGTSIESLDLTTQKYAFNFLFGGIVMVLILFSLRTCCRSKVHHPLNSEISNQEFETSENARKICQVVCILIICSLQAFHQCYLKGIEDIYTIQNYNFIRKSSIVFSGVFLFLTMLIMYTERFFMYSLVTQEVLHDEAGRPHPRRSDGQDVERKLRPAKLRPPRGC